ncbi:hypothetical protein BDS110ZK12_00500 [Bradyrhizobium diazoefficiens]|uniref:Uncharacterized protein n=1 Tax=Bradyrhizobium diazoefficiens TaxID=1355477 RepID=A0A810ARF7_9BRAD|nr:hypothetical protein XF6B_38500 [Bradyrhizobium diazoefficiens]BCE99780.1 hypothetical protein XF11B_38010 [Bradyrhizobium diazoefficiens]BCF08433.1 hypothetical protein XF12B_38060 [Bradyrhizobium diazoefficiens]
MSVIAAEADTFTVLRRFASSGIVSSTSHFFQTRGLGSARKSQFANDLERGYDLDHRDVHPRRRSHRERNGVGDVFGLERLEAADEPGIRIVGGVLVLEDARRHAPGRDFGDANAGAVEVDAQLLRERMNARLRRVIGHG